MDACKERPGSSPDAQDTQYAGQGKSGSFLDAHGPRDRIRHLEGLQQHPDTQFVLLISLTLVVTTNTYCANQFHFM